MIINIIYILTTCSLIAFIIYLLVKLKNYKKYEIEEEGTGKIGIIKLISYGVDNLYGIVEIEEIESTDHMTKIKILNIYPSKKYPNDTKDRFQRSIEEWVNTDEIKWMSNWQQNIRKSKIKKLLDNK